MEQLVTSLQPYFTTKAPFQLPDNWKEIIVKIAPWLVLVVIILSLPALLIILSAGAFLSTTLPIYGYTVGTIGFFFWVSWLATVIEIILLIIAFPGLRSRTIKGWNAVFYAALVSFAASILNSLGTFAYFGGIITAVIGIVIALYILFQIRPYYTGEKKIAAAPAAPTPTAS